MGLFRKRKSDEQEHDGVGQDIAEAGLASTVVTDSSEDSEAELERALTDQYLKRDTDPDQDDEATRVQDGPADATDLFQEAVEPEGQGGDDEASDGDDSDDNLMDIFTSEEAEDEDMLVLTQGLEEVDAASLLAEARDLASRFRSRVGNS